MFSQRTLKEYQQENYEDSKEALKKPLEIEIKADNFTMSDTNELKCSFCKSVVPKPNL